eukprot:GILK01013012.1.p1 GENE.GILK01013012.1~~GILK01013012.1.p1  ORF type:complete len:125 (+),score=0.66 GILK01013012.1:494-868(+)
MTIPSFGGNYPCRSKEANCPSLMCVCEITDRSYPPSQYTCYHMKRHVGAMCSSTQGTWLMYSSLPNGAVLDQAYGDVTYMVLHNMTYDVTFQVILVFALLLICLCSVHHCVVSRANIIAIRLDK